MLIKLIKVDASEVYKYLAKFQNEYYKTVSWAFLLQLNNAYFEWQRLHGLIFWMY
jgi:hypothetical protein